jgi:hypothetical protein
MPGLVPQTPNARVNFGDILDAISAKLVADGIGTDSQICWGLPDQVPEFCSPFDILLVARNGTHDKRDGGAAELRMNRMVDIYYRSQGTPDPGGGWRAYVAAVFIAGDTVINSVGNDEFSPEDADGNLLTLETIKLVGDSAPDYPRPASVYGSYVCTLEIAYFPLVDPSVQVNPMP